MLTTDRTLYFIIGLFVVAVSVLHYSTPVSLHPLHEVYKVLYFIPILLAAFGFGLRGGLLCAGIVTVLYLPHVMFQWGGLLLMNISRFLMILLYLIIGGLTGYLWQREKEERQRYQQTSEQLEKSLDQLKETSEELVEIESQLLRAERLSTLGELTASLAHEVRNPMGSIRGVAEILRDESHDKRHEKFVDILLKETNRLDGVVTQYLSFAQSKNVERDVIVLKDIIESTLALLGPEIRKKGLKIDVQVIPKDIQFFFNEGQMRQVLMNVLLNAIQASPENDIIKMSGYQNKHKVFLKIEDRGPGLSEHVQNHLFEPFYTNKPDGTGLGLAISKRIMDNHNGQIRIDSGTEQGATFVLEFRKSDDK